MADLPTTMRAAVYRTPHDVSVEEVPVPEVGPDDVLVEVGWCGVCGTDLHTFLDGWSRPGSIGGHEWSGTVVEVGNEVRAISPGDHVVGGPSPTCGECRPCTEGRRSLCVDRPTPGSGRFQGAFARYVKVIEAEAVPVPEGLEVRVAALTEPLAVALHALTQGEVRPGMRALVTGAGPIGALVLAALRAAGVDDVTVSEPSRVRRALAERLGASAVVTPDALVVPPPHEPMLLPAEPFDVAFECAGKAEAQEAALAQLGKGGRLVLVGAGMASPKFDPNRILLNELVITGAYEYDADGYSAALDLLSSGKLPVDLLIEPDDVPFEGMLAALEGLAAGEVAGKILIVPRR